MVTSSITSSSSPCRIAAPPSRCTRRMPYLLRSTLQRVQAESLLPGVTRRALQVAQSSDSEALFNWERSRRRLLHRSTFPSTDHVLTAVQGSGKSSLVSTRSRRNRSGSSTHRFTESAARRGALVQRPAQHVSRVRGTRLRLKDGRCCARRQNKSPANSTILFPTFNVDGLLLGHLREFWFLRT
jgi:hypothetical protein